MYIVLFVHDDDSGRAKNAIILIILSENGIFLGKDNKCKGYLGEEDLKIDRATKRTEEKESVCVRVCVYNCE